MLKLDKILSKLIDDIHIHSKNDGKILCIFDLDSTLYDVSPRTKYIFSELISDPETQYKYPKEIEKLSSTQVFDSDWGLQDALDRVDLHNNDFSKHAKNFWALRFFSNEYLQYDLPYEGAVFFVNQLYSTTQSHLKYLSGRDQIRMAQGTIESLRHWKFPIELQNVELILKPKPKMDDVNFKVEKIRTMNKSYDLIYLFENEPAIVHAVETEFSNVQIVFMDSVHSRKAEPLALWPFLEKSYLLKKNE